MTAEDQAFLNYVKRGLVLTLIVVVAGVSLILWRLRRL